ncbi:MAG: MAPEG family protein [Rhizobiaceae bacterium]|mgnify:CR=1 FL=1|nr:MAPEG family protein [Hyphomicrobiales bacterium]
MNQTMIFWPVIAQVLLVFIVYGLLSLRRTAAIKAGNVKLSDFRANRHEPRESIFIHNNLLNQFQLPVLFYIVCLCLYVTEGNSTVTIVLAWIFVAARYIHAAVHMTTNRMPYRQSAFAVGYVVLGLLWVWFALHLLVIV